MSLELSGPVWLAVDCWHVVDDTRSFLVRGKRPAHWEPQEEGMMSIAASFPSVMKPRFNIVLGEERQ
jgi:hypothetical protein